MALNLGVLVGLGVITDEKVKVSADDTTASYLQSKIAAGSNITLTVLNDGANEQLQITAAGGTSPSIGGTITSGTQYAVLFVDPAGTFAEDVANFNFNNSTNRLGIGTTATNARVDIKGEGLTDATSAIYVANATPYVLFQIKNDGTFLLGKGASAFDLDCVTIGHNSITTGVAGTSVGALATSATYGVAIGAATATSYSIAIGHLASANNTSIAIKGTANSSGAAISLGSTVTGGQGVGIGYYSSALADYATCLGGSSYASAANSMAIGASSRSTASGAYIFANSTNANAITNSEASTMLIGWNDASAAPSFRLTKNSNFILRSILAITSGTHYDANATNVVTIHDGTAPAGAITDACQVFTNADGQLQYMDDSGFTVTL